jgi:hypothetical protein
MIEVCAKSKGGFFGENGQDNVDRFTILDPVEALRYE